MANANGTASPADNPHFKFIDRAPYELGYLLRKLPVDFSISRPLTPDDRLIAEAARSQAMNANDTLLHGLEALGQVMFVAGANEQNEVDAGHMASLGCLIGHIAVEIQFMQETEWSIRETLAAHDENDAVQAAKSKKGGA